MFKLGKYARSLIRIVLYSIGLSIFLEERWIVAGGNFFDNVVAGIVLYAVAWLGALIFASVFNGGRR